MKSVLLIFAIVVGLVLLSEIGLRILFGFGNPLLYQADPHIGYLLTPNQSVRRFGNRIQINHFSMRGEDISSARPANVLRVLLLGDSIANGGWWTDQPQILSRQLERQLQPLLESLDPSLHQVEVLNASANSWSPRNQLAYLRRFGAFDAQVIVLLLNTDDLFGTVPTSLPVGRDRNYPDRKPIAALAEVTQRYLLKPQPNPALQAIHAEKGDRVGTNLAAIEQIQAIAQQHNAGLLVAMTPLRRELGTPGSREYEARARQRLQDFTQEAQLPYLDFLPTFNAQPAPEILYRDHIHLSPVGNQQVSQAIAEMIAANR